MIGPFTEPPRPRKVVQISQVPESIGANSYSIVALCDDGTMWHSDVLGAHAVWYQLPNVPQPVATYE
jgi:hypothetical protein